MDIIYHCFGGAHSSVTAAHIHLGNLPEDQLPAIEDFYRLPMFDCQVSKQHGYIRFLGTDHQGNQVFFLGRKNTYPLIENLFYSLGEIMGLTKKKNLLLINVVPNVNLHMRVGGFLSRKMGLASIGRPIVAKGTQKSYFKIVEVVRKVKKECAGL